MSDLDENRTRAFIKNTLKDYEKTISVTDFIQNVEIIENGGSAEGFKEIAVHPRVESKIFFPPEGPQVVAPMVIGLGRSIALRELQYFAEKLLGNSIIQREQTETLEFKNFKPMMLRGELGYTKSNVIVSTAVKPSWYATKEWMEYINFRDRDMYFDDEFPVITLSEDIIGKRIIILDKNSVKWTFKTFNNTDTNSFVRLEIIPGTPIERSIDVFVRSLVKFEIINPSEIKVFNII